MSHALPYMSSTTEMSVNSADYGPVLNLGQRPNAEPSKFSWTNKRFCLDLVRGGFAELVATLLYVFAGLTSFSNFSGNSSPHLPTVALTFGFSFAGLSAAMQHASGGHLNPAVTLGVFIAGGVHLIKAVVYVLAQLLGGIIGALVVLVSEVNFAAPCAIQCRGTIDTLYNGTPLYIGTVYQSSFEKGMQNLTKQEAPLDINVTDVSTVLEDAATVMNSAIKPEMAIFIEMLLTLMFVIVFIHTSMEKKELQSTSPALCGLTLAAGILAGYELTGGSLNPARSFGPAVVCASARVWRDQYVYWIGPLLGGAIAGLFYRLVFSSKTLNFCNERCCKSKRSGYAEIS